MAKRKKMNELQMMKFQSEREEIRGTPEILQSSRKMVEELKIKPLHQRAPEILKFREDKRQIIKSKVKQSELDRNPSPTFRPDLSASLSLKKTQEIHKHSRSMDKVVADVYTWNQNKEEKIQKKSIERYREELKETTFHPNIDKHSENLLRKVDE